MVENIRSLTSHCQTVQTQEIAVNNQRNFKITLKEDTEVLDEVVVVGYGTMKKSDYKSYR